MMIEDLSGYLATLRMEINATKGRETAVEKAAFSELSKKLLCGVDFSKVDMQKVLSVLGADMLKAEAEGVDFVPSRKALAAAGLSKEEFVLISEKVVLNFSKHTVTGRQSRALVDKLDDNKLSAVKGHLLKLFDSMTRKEVSKLSKKWDVNLQHFKCITCNLQQKDCEKKLLRCGDCGEFFYCSKVCQKTHWKEGGHKNTCAKSLLPAAQ